MIDGHMHLEYGPLSIEYVKEFVNEALKKGIDEIQILDHTHRFKEFEKTYDELRSIEVQDKWLSNKEMKFKDSLDDYLKLIEEAKKENFPIKVKFGLEVCYTSKSEDFLRNLLKNYHFDFLIGSVHSIEGILYDMSFSKELLWEKMSVDDIYQKYYSEIFKLVDSGLFTQLGHPDTIKLFNYYPTYDLSDTYRTLAKKLKKMNMKAECNTGCSYRYGHKDVGLSDELLKIFKEENVSIITASDAHHPEHVGTNIKEAVQRIQGD
ncbi:MAG: histidinol-phosphatase [Erysipelotrichaceae bacterium]|nr:histidinol-phosphatase [Erysipelotrichaceae bacterium]